MSRSRFLLAAAFCVVVLLAPFAWGQENATITGTVLDPTGAVVPNVSHHSHQRRNWPSQRDHVEQLRHLSLR